MLGRVTGKLVYFSLYSISYGIRSTVSGLLQSKAVYSVYCAFSFSAQVFNSISSRIITLFLSFQLGLSKVATFIAPYCFALIVPVVCLSFFSNFQSIYAFYGLNNLAFFAASFNVSNWPRFLTSLFLNLISNIYKGACGFILTKAVDSWSKPWGILKAPAYIFLFVLSVLPHALFIERRIIRADKLFSVDATLLQNIRSKFSPL